MLEIRLWFLVHLKHQEVGCPHRCKNFAAWLVSPTSKMLSLLQTHWLSGCTKGVLPSFGGCLKNFDTFEKMSLGFSLWFSCRPTSLFRINGLVCKGIELVYGPCHLSSNCEPMGWVFWNPEPHILCTFPPFPMSSSSRSRQVLRSSALQRVGITETITGFGIHWTAKPPN